jgi:thymidine kinase
MAKLYFRYGAMNCGKSAALMQVAHNYDENNKKILLIKSSVDTKGDNYLISRIGLKRKVDILLNQDESLEKYYDEIKDNISCVLTDESQFFTPKQIDELWYISKILDVPVICYGLRTDFRGILFEGSKRLLELADELEELITICACGKRAKFNARYVNEKFTMEGSSVEIDGNDSKITYKPMCGKCFLQEKIKYENGK